MPGNEISNLQNRLNTYLIHVRVCVIHSCTLVTSFASSTLLSSLKHSFRECKKSSKSSVQFVNVWVHGIERREALYRHEKDTVLY